MNARSAIAQAVVLLACLAAGCGGGGASPSSGESPAIPHDVGLQLAGRTSAVEASLNRGDACAALDQAMSLERAEADAIATGQIPSQLRAALVSSTRTLVAEIPCVKPPPAAKPPHHHHNHGHGNGEGD